MSFDQPTLLPDHFFCTAHQKRAYRTRKLARRGARAMHDHGVREYACTKHRGWWHNGHTPPFVLRGELTRDEFYALPKAVQRYFWMIEAEYGTLGDGPRRGAGVPAGLSGRARAVAVQAGGAHGDDPGGGQPLPERTLGDLAGGDRCAGGDRPGPEDEDRVRAS